MEVHTMQARTMQVAMQAELVEWERVDWDPVLLLQVGDLVVLSAVEVCMLVVATMLLVVDSARGVVFLSRQARDVELVQDQPTLVVV
jgi:hypothetical protein